MRVLMVGLIVLLLAGCVSTSPELPPAASGTVDAEPTRTEVQWADYDGSVKERIDALEAAKDCVGLQEEFDAADANSSATLDRTGHGNAKLMGYIDEAMRLAACY